MFILNQDGSKVCNLDSAGMLRLESYSNCCEIWFGHISGETETLLGKYTSEERGKEILHEILKYNDTIEKDKIMSICSNYMFLNKKTYFEMPKEEEE